MGCMGNVARMGYMVFWMGKPEGKKPLRRPDSKWEDNIKMVFPEVGMRAWIGLFWPRDSDRWQAAVNA